MPKIATVCGLREMCLGCGDTIPRESIHYVPSTYGSPEGYLCKGCHDNEEAQMEDAGTNYLPKLLERYKA